MLPATFTTKIPRLRPQVLPDCAICNDLKFVIPVANGVSGRAVPCRCYEKVLTAQREQVLLQNGPHAFAGAGCLPPALQQTTLQNFVAAGRNQSIALAQCREFARNPQGWLLLAGKVGSGKTHLVAAVANARLAQQQPISFTNTADLLDAIRSTYDSHTYDKTFRAICKLPLLLLTDLGHENRTPWAQEKPYQLFDHRSLHQLPMVITTSIAVSRLDGRIAKHLLHSPDCKTLALQPFSIGKYHVLPQ